MAKIEKKRVNFNMPKPLWDWYESQTEEKMLTHTTLYIIALQHYMDSQIALKAMSKDGYIAQMIKETKNMQDQAKKLGQEEK